MVKAAAAIEALSKRTQEWALDATRQGRRFLRMDHSKKKFSGSRQEPKKGPPLGLVITLAAAGGVVIGSAGTYFLSKPLDAPKQSAAPAAVPVAGGTQQAQTITMSPKQQFTPAPQPPGEVPPGKVWSAEHGHWHDDPAALKIPVTATATPAPATATPLPATATPASATATPAPTTTPATPEKKE